MSKRHDGETIPSPADTLDIALSLARAGWAVFPVRLVSYTKPDGSTGRDKRPLVKWLEGATTDAETIAAWWQLDFPDAWIGVHAERSGIVVVDIDEHGALEAAGIDLPTTFTYTTGRGGEHHVYHAPEGRKLTIAKGHPVAGVDIRAGHGLMVYYGPKLDGPPRLAPAPSWALLDGKVRSGNMLAPNDVDTMRWLAAQRDGKAPKPERKLAERVQPTGLDHDGMLDVVNRLVAAGTGGAPGIAGLLTEARSRYLVGRPDRARDWDNALAGSVAHYGLPPVTLDIPKAERKALAKKAKEPKPKSGKARPIEDNPLAVELAEVLADSWAFTEATGLLRWDGKVWQHSATMGLVERVRWELARVELEEHEKALGWSDEKMRQQRLDKLRGLLSAKKARDVAALVTGILAKADLKTDMHPDLLNTPSGVVDLRTKALSPHDPALMLTKITAAAYVPGATNPDWTAALEAVPAKVRPWLQVRFGQAITGHMTPDDKLILLQGGGSNAKSTVLDATRVCLGDFSVTVPERLLLSNPGDHPTELTTLMGARYAVIEELPEGRNLNVKRLKDAVGTPVITARRMREDNMSWRATHTLFLSTNYYPIVAEVDAGTWRRLALVRFPYRYTELDDPKRQAGDRVADVGIRKRLGEAPNEAVLAWLVDGAHRWYTDGMPPLPKVVARDTQAWRVEADPVLAYAAERLELDPGYAIASTDLFDDFNEWLSRRGHKEWGLQTFNTRVGGHEAMAEVESKRTRFGPKMRASRPPLSMKAIPENTVAWRGVRFKTTAPSIPMSAEVSDFERRLRES